MNLSIVSLQIRNYYGGRSCCLRGGGNAWKSVDTRGRFLRGVNDQVGQLRTEFGHIQSLLKDADRKQHDNETIRNWIKEIRLLACRAEDLVEEYVVKVGSGNGDLGFINILKRFVCFSNELHTFHNLFSSEIEGITSQINYLTGHMNQFGILISQSYENKRSFIRKTFPHQELQHFVGMDEDIEKLVSLLVDDKESRHRVIGVWGIGGSGKTTVAKKVYKHVDVKRFFDSFAWVCITRKCQIQSVMQDIFRQLLPAERNNDIEDTNELEEKIYNVQMEKKCLIVLDDIWKFNDWKSLSKCFPNFVSQSKVLLTNRSVDVAEIGYPIQLKSFTEDEAWKLLREKAFANIDLEEALDDNHEYEVLGREMVQKCDCLPLTIAVLGGILSGKKSLEEWKLASDDVNSYIGRGDGTGEVEKVLALSYDELPYHLKPCFLSLGFLQEDERTSVERIYDMWMAEGLIQSKHVGSSEPLRDAAKCYLYELQFRSMVVLHDHSTSLSLHDSILDFCRSKAKEEEFLMVVDRCIIPENAYRLVVHVDDEYDDLDVLRSAENISTPLRSVQIIRKPFSNFINLPKKIFYLPEFKSLRVLIFVSYGLRGKCFHGIENLIHLRLLGLMGCEWGMFSLEHSVDKLSFLQTLDLTGTTVSLLKSPPVDTFCKMRQLRHLYLPLFPDGFRIEGKLRLANLSQLETLYHLQSNFYELGDLIHLQKLRTLGCTITDDESLEQITDYMCGSNLRWIYLTTRYCDLFLSDSLRKLLNIPNVTLELHIESCMLLKLPPLETLDFLTMNPGLVNLSIGHTDIAEDIMQVLDKFPNLKKLQLKSIRFGGDEMICGAGSFPRLEELSLFSVEGKFELRMDEAAMPNLSSMEIAGCSGINFMIPERLKLLI